MGMQVRILMMSVYRVFQEGRAFSGIVQISIISKNAHVHLGRTVKVSTEKSKRIGEPYLGFQHKEDVGFVVRVHLLADLA